MIKRLLLVFALLCAPALAQVTLSGNGATVSGSGIVFGNNIPNCTITTSTLPDGTVSLVYSQSINTANCTAPLTWTTVGGSLPAGLTLTTPTAGIVGTISGTPTTATTYGFTVQVTDANGKIASQIFNLTVDPTCTISTLSLPNGVTGTAYSQPVNTAGCVAPLTWSVTSGSLPTGLSQNASTGVISGTPTVAGTSTFTVSVTDSLTHTASQPLSIIVASGATCAITTTSPLPAGTINSPYSTTISTSNCTAPLNWSVSVGTLPTGLNLGSTIAATNTISGTPTATGTSNFTIQVIDNLSNVATQPFALSINAVTGASENAYCSLTNTWTGAPTDAPAQAPLFCYNTALSSTPAPGSTINVITATDLTNALSTVACGQHIDIAPGLLQGSWTLPAKSCDGAHYIFIETSQIGNAAFPVESTRVTPCSANISSVTSYPSYPCPSPANLMPILQATGTNQAVFNAAAGANHYRIMGLYLKQVASGVNSNGLINLTAGADHIILDRNLLQGVPMNCSLNTTTGGWACSGNDVNVGVNTSNSTYVAINNNWIWDIGSNGTFSDAKAVFLGGVSCSNNEDVKKLYNNFLAATGEDFLAGGGGCGATATTITPNDFEIRHNHLYKPAIWMLCVGGSGTGCQNGSSYSPGVPEIKNNGELKNANRVLIEGNTCENSWMPWQSDQSGYCMLLTPKNQSSISFVTATSNSSGTTLTGSFPSSVTDAHCATPGHCNITFNGVSTQAQSWTSSSITVSPAVTPNLTASAKTCAPGLNPTAHVTNVIFRWNHIMNSTNGIQFAAATSDCGDVSNGISAVAIHDLLFEGINSSLQNSKGGNTKAACMQITNGQANPNNVFNYRIEHLTCIAQGGAFGFSGVDATNDLTDQDTAGATGAYFSNRIQQNNIGAAGGIGQYKQGSLYPGGLAAALAQQSCTPAVTGSTCTWTYTKNVLGVGLWPSQTNNAPFPSTNQVCGGATCFPAGSAFTSQFVNYNGPNGQPGYLGNYQLTASSPYRNSGTDAKDVGVSDWTTYNTLLSGVASTTNYTVASITTTSLPNAALGVAYCQALAANQASSFQWWTVSSGSLPPGMSLATPGSSCSAWQWAISGTPTTVGTYNFTLQLMDAAQQYATQTYTVVVGGSSGGSSWTALPLAGLPTNPQIDGFDVKQSNGHIFLTERSTGIWKSLDGGQTVTQINTGLPVSTGTWVGCAAGLICGWTVVVNPHTGDLIANTEGNPSHYYVSHDESTWTQISEPAGFSLTSTGSFDGGLMPLSSGGLMLLGGRGCTGCTQMYSSNDGSTTSLSIFSPGQGETESNGINGSTYAFGGETAGFYTSTNSGANFTQVWKCGTVGPTCSNSNDTNEVYAITTDGSGNWVIATMTGVFKSSGSVTAPTAWTHLYTSSARSRTIFRSSSGNYWYGQAQLGSNATVRRSTDGGATWPEYDTGIGTGLEAHRFVQYAPSNLIYALIENGSTDVGTIYYISGN